MAGPSLARSNWTVRVGLGAGRGGGQGRAAKGAWGTLEWWRRSPPMGEQAAAPGFARRGCGLRPIEVVQQLAARPGLRRWPLPWPDAARGRTCSLKMLALVRQECRHRTRSRLGRAAASDDEGCIDAAVSPRSRCRSRRCARCSGSDKAFGATACICKSKLIPVHMCYGVYAPSSRSAACCEARKRCVQSFGRAYNTLVAYTQVWTALISLFCGPAAAASKCEERRVT